jgi:hypothetical protein
MKILKPILAALALATLCGNAPAVWERARIAAREYPQTLKAPFNCGDPVVDERRALVREHLPAGEPLYLFEPSRKGFTSRLRMIRIGLAWEAMPGKVIHFSEGAPPLGINYLATAVYEGPLPVADDALVSLSPEGEGPVWGRERRASARHSQASRDAGRKPGAPGGARPTSVSAPYLLGW